MKRSLFTFVVCLSSCLSASAQSFWENAGGPEGVNINTLQYSPQGILYGKDYAYPVKTTFRSLDQGLHWEALTGPNNSPSIDKLSIGLDGTLFCRGSNFYDIYYSTNHGDSWSYLSTPYNSYGDITSATDGAFIQALGNAIVRSYDKISWDTLFTQTFPWPFNDLNLSKLGWLKDGRLVAEKTGFLPSGADISFLISSDAGMSWDTFPDPSPSPLDLTMLPNGQFVTLNSQGLICLSNLGAEPDCFLPPFAPLPQPNDAKAINFLVTPSGRLIVTNYYEALYSDDQGASWHPHPTGIESSLLHELLDGEYLLSKSYFDGNTARSTDLGQTWTFSGYGPDRSWSFDWVFTSDEKVYAISNGVWKSTDGGSQWKLILRDSLHSYQGYYNLALSTDDQLYVLGYFGLWKTSDQGNTFQNISPDPSLGKFYRVAVQPQTNALYLTGQGLIRSLDQGLTWTVLDTSSSFFTQPIVFHPSGTFYSCAFVEGQTNRQLVRSEDGGISWQFVAVSPSPNYNYFDFVNIMPDGKIIVAGPSGYAVSMDNGFSWQRQNVPLYMGTLAINALGHAYIGDVNSKKVFKTENDGHTWTALPDIPSDLQTGIINLAIAPDQQLWVCTDGDGHFKTSTATGIDPGPKTEPVLLSIFPNPAKGAFWVKWSGPASKEAPTLVLRNLLGQEILRQPALNNPAPIDCSNLATGYYTLEILSAGRSLGMTKVMVNR